LHRFCLIHPCDGQTDGQTDRQTELRWLRRAIAVPAVARKNYRVDGVDSAGQYSTQ